MLPRRCVVITFCSYADSGRIVAWTHITMASEPDWHAYQQITIVDPRTMKVLLVQEGWGGDYPSQLTQVAQQNKLP